MNRLRHDGSVVVISGASSGIGKAIALKMAAEGAVVIGCARTKSRLDEVGDEIRALGQTATMVAADVSNGQEVSDLADYIVREHGRVDALVNAAGVSDYFVPLHELTDTQWHRVLDINVTGVMLMSRAMLPAMRAQESGVIVNVSSVAGFRGGMTGFAYTASKHAVIGMTRSLAWAYRGEGIRCNALCPGAVDTGFGADSESSEWGYQRLKPVHRLAGGLVDAERIAETASWLASPESSALNGSVVTADAGWSAG
jgi:NAD(P)-dependent dehydrogenase (short-subunit alcohol dehydrogenase family)